MTFAILVLFLKKVKVPVQRKGSRVATFDPSLRDRVNKRDGGLVHQTSIEDRLVCSIKKQYNILMNFENNFFRKYIFFSTL